MLQIENTEVYGWQAAIRGMRNPKNSWDKSDSAFIGGDALLGENDLGLMESLSKAGSDHGKFLRMINVTMDVTAPLYWWKEFETYRIGVAENPGDIELNSCSTMHKIHAKEFTIEDFSYEHLMWSDRDAPYFESGDILYDVITMLNIHREKYIETKDKKHWWQMIQLLPSSYNQRRTMQLNYQALKNMYHARKNHKLDEWHIFCDWIRELPYAEELICTEVKR